MAGSAPTPRRCPRCGTSSIPIRYGYPSPDGELMRRAERGEAEIGGCSVSPDAPSRRCRGCGSSWGQAVQFDDIFQAAPDPLVVAMALARAIGTVSWPSIAHRLDPLTRVHVPLAAVDWRLPALPELGETVQLSYLEWFAVGDPAFALLGIMPEGCIVARAVHTTDDADGDILVPADPVARRRGDDDATPWFLAAIDALM